MPLKISLRRNLLKEMSHPVILETHGGYGKIFELCYAHLLEGVVFEKDPDKASYLALQRPTWAVYEADCEIAVRGGIGSHLAVNFLDLDPYGSPWEIIKTFFENWPEFPDRLAVAVTDGLRQKCRMQGAWSVRALAEMVAKYGNQVFYLNYKEICRELMEKKAARVGYRLERWAAYYCGFAGQMTHYGAILERS